MTTLDERRAEGIVNALVDQESCRCTCGERIDVSDATTSMQVVVKLEKHRKVCTATEQSQD